MPSIKDLRNRITTIKNTQQTTKAMKMVSAAKLRKAQEAIVANRPFSMGILKMTRRVAHHVSLKDIPHIIPYEKVVQNPHRKLFLVIMTLDRGLCGGFNINLLKATLEWLKQNANIYQKINIAVVGKKGYEFFKRQKMKQVTYYPQFSGKATFLKAKELSQILLQHYLETPGTEIKFFYNEFVNAMTQKIRYENFLPIEPMVTPEESSDFLLIQPNPQRVLQTLLEKNFHMQVFRILLESQAGEHGARMTAMDNATKNANDMIENLTLQYNKQRQAAITKELIEIVAGNESQAMKD